MSGCPESENCTVKDQKNRDFYKFQEEFNQDIPDLIVAGIEDTEISLMMDQLRYVLSDSL